MPNGASYLQIGGSTNLDLGEDVSTLFWKSKIARGSFLSFEKAGGGQTALTQYTNNPAKPDRQWEKHQSQKEKDFEEYLHNLWCSISPAFKEMTFASGKHLFMRWENTANDMRMRFFIDIKECM